MSHHIKPFGIFGRKIQVDDFGRNLHITAYSLAVLGIVSVAVIRQLNNSWIYSLEISGSFLVVVFLLEFLASLREEIKD